LKQSGPFPALCPLSFSLFPSSSSSSSFFHFFAAAAAATAAVFDYVSRAMQPATALFPLSFVIYGIEFSGDSLRLFLSLGLGGVKRGIQEFVSEKGKKAPTFGDPFFL